MYGHGGDRQSAKFQAGNRQLEAPAWERAGFSAAVTRKAQKVVSLGCAELIAAVDRKEITVSAAEVIADLDAEEQRKILAMSKWERKEAVRDLRLDRQALSTHRITIPVNAKRAARILIKHLPESVLRELVDELNRTKG